MDIAARGGRNVEPRHQRLDTRDQGRRIGANDEAIGARLNAERQFGRRAGQGGIDRQLRHDAFQQIRHIDRTRVLQFQHLQFGAGRYIDRRDDLGDALHIFRVIGDDQHVVTRIGADEIVRRHQRPQHGGKLSRVFILQREYLCDDAVARYLRGAIDHGAGCLGVGLGNDLHHTAFLDCCVAAHAQRRQQNLVGDILGHGRLRHDVHVARHTRIDDEIFPGVAADGFHHGSHVGVDEIEGDGVLRVHVRDRRQTQGKQGGQDGKAFLGILGVAHRQSRG